MKRLIVVGVALIICCCVNASPADICEEIENAFRNSTEQGEIPACRCLPEEMGAMRGSRNYKEEGDGIWIGCTRQNMPSVFRALNSLNETLISHLWIWNSLINILPNDMFAKVRPKILTIENSRVSVFRAGAFGNIGRRLKSLYLKNNILKSIEKQTFADLNALEILDLTGNKLTELKAGQLDNPVYLETLMLSDNQINHIEDGAFKALINLKTLNLANNKLTNITKNTFQGLNNLEVLSIQGNNLGTIDWNAFSHMKRLRTLDFGTNHLTRVELRGLENLQRLYLNNNSINSLKNVSLRDLPSLSVLSMDRNQISSIGDNDLSSLSQSSRLASLSFAENNISVIEGQAFEHVHQLTVLSLQNNQLPSLTSPPRNGMIPYLRPLKKLRVLSLARNKISNIEDGEINVLSHLKELTLDHNRIEKINTGALKGLRLSKFFINSNRLYYLPEGTFDSWHTDDLEAVDLSDNLWECICGSEWIGPWLTQLGDRNSPSGDLGCLQYRCNEEAEKQRDQQSFILTIIASCVAVVAFVILVAIGYMYAQEYFYGTVSVKRVPSDMVRLIPSMESLSYPNPFSPNAEKGIINLAAPQSAIPKPATKSAIDSSSTNNNSNNNNESPTKSSEKKRVRFGGIY
jgi:Leucine-rich repeat (LRR) protein